MRRDISITLRYAIIFLFSLFYKAFYPLLSVLTLYSSYFILGIFYPASLNENIISFGSKSIQLIDACISGLAYLLLLVLNLSVEMPFSKRAKSLCLSFLLFFVYNLFRIVFLSSLFLSEFSFFDAAHLFFWYAGSLIAVLLIWLLEIKLFRLTDIPVWSDMQYLMKELKSKR